MSTINKIPPGRAFNLNQYQSMSSGSAVYPGSGTFNGLVYTTLKMNGEAGELAEKVGKWMRDGGNWDEKRDEMIRELGDVLWYVAASARELSVSLEDVANRNLEKLRDRQSRGQLQGSGDNR